MIGDKEIKIERLVAAERARPVARVAPTREAQTSFLLMFPKLRDPLVQGMLSIPSMCITPSRVVQLLNMFYPEDLLEEDFFRRLVRNVRAECEKFGKVEAIEVPRPDPQTGRCAASVGKVFVLFESQREAMEARYRLNGRSYNKRTVVASFYNEEKFMRRDFSFSL